jgi:hypothetical protein
MDAETHNNPPGEQKEEGFSVEDQLAGRYRPAHHQ